MKYAVLILLAAAAYLGWQRYGREQPADSNAEAEVAAPQDKDKTPGANLQNRVDTLSGTAPGM